MGKEVISQVVLEEKISRFFLPTKTKNEERSYFVPAPKMPQFSSMFLHQENILKCGVIAVSENELVALFICPQSPSSRFAVSNRVIHMLGLHTCFGALLDQGLIDTLIDRLG